MQASLQKHEVEMQKLNNMKVEKLLLKAFNWYYEERMWNTNISNEEALELFKETDTYQDFYDKASDDATSQDKALNLAGVSGSLLIRSLHLLEEMIDNHDADAVRMTDDHYNEIKKLIKDIRRSRRMQ